MGWLKSFRKNDEREPTVPDTGGAQASFGAPRQSNGSGGSKSYASGSASGGRSTHDIAMAAAVLSSAGPSRPPPHPAPPLQQPHSQDEDVAMAYRLALEEQASAQGWPPQPRPAGAPSFQGFQMAPPPPRGRPNAVSRQHDVTMATALAESKFAARQAEELERNSKQVYLAAVIQALEASLVTADYDAVLRDIKLWTIDLAAASDEVQAALAAARRRRAEVAARLEAMDPTDEAKAFKLGWLAEQLPLAEARLERLALRLTPVVVAVLELRELREHVAAASPPLAQAEARRDAIIAALFKDMSAAGLGGRPSHGGGAAGVSTGGAAAPTDIREMVAALVLEAQRIPPAPATKVPASVHFSASEGPASPVPSASGTESVGADLDEATREQRRVEKEERRQRREEHTRRKEAAQAAAEKAAAEERRRAAEEQREGEERERLRRQAEAEDAAEEERRRQERQREQLEAEERVHQEAEAAQERQRRLAEIEAAAEAEQKRVKEEEAAQREAAEELRRTQQREHEERESEARRRQEEEEAAAALQREVERERQTAEVRRQRRHEQKDDEAHRKAAALAGSAAAAAITQSAVDHSVQEPPQTPVVPASAPRAASAARSTHSTPPGAPASTAAPITPGSTSQSPVTPPSQPAGAKPGGTASFKEFNLSAPRTHYKSSGAKPAPGDAIRRVPAFFSLHHALGKDEEGVVAQAVGWEAGKAVAGSGGGGRLRRSLHWLSPPGGAGKKQQRHGATGADGAPPGPAELASFKPRGMDAVVDFVAAHGGLPAEDDTAAPAEGAVAAADEPGPRDYGSDRWGTMCEAAALHRKLAGMAEALGAWEVDPGAGALAEAHRLADFMCVVAKEAGRVGQAYDPLRARMARHGVPWEESVLTDLRWAAQGAAAALMRFALDCCSGAEKTKGSWQRQAVLQPLGHAVMGVFPVHQFAGGFSSGATALADQLVERTVHYARLIDPKWLRSTRLVAA